MFFFWFLYIYIYYFTFSVIFQAVGCLIISRAVTNAFWLRVSKSTESSKPQVRQGLRSPAHQWSALQSCHYHAEIRTSKFLRSGAGILFKKKKNQWNKKKENMTKSIAVDLVSLRRAMFAAHKESSRSVPEESDCNLLDPSLGGKAGEL